MSASIIRTVVPLIVALLVGWAARIGLHLDSNALAILVTAVIGFVYYTAARLLEQRWPAAGRLLLSAGLVKAQPVYAAPGATVITGTMKGSVTHPPAAQSGSVPPAPPAAGR